MVISPSKIFEVYEAQDRGKRKLYTLNMVPGTDVYGEMLVFGKMGEFREWNPGKSKLCSYILKGAQNVGIRKGSSVLYLGCASGTTVSHISDMAGEEGIIFAVDISPSVMRDMLFLSEKRSNIAPLLESASHVDKLLERVSLVDVLYQDVAQRDQVAIFLKNAEMFLKEKGYGLLAVKSRSIDVAARPRDIFKQVRAQLEKSVTVIDARELDPFQKDHCMFMIKK